MVDEIIRYGTLGLTVGAALLAPNIMIALDKPLKRLYRHLDNNERERELRRIMYYMKERGYLVGKYEHGLQLTDKARARLLKSDSELSATPQQVWDGWWRVIIYDIPEEHKSARQMLQTKLRDYGCYILQRSVYVTPFPCLEDINTMAARCEVDEFVTYFEAKNLANDKAMLRLFKKKYPTTIFQ